MAKPTQTVKGHNAEREYRLVFKDELGFSFCITSRQGSRIHDDAGIDLINIPFNVQIKAGYKRGLNTKTVLDYTKNKVSELFPPDAKEHDLPTILVHKMDVGRGKRREETDDIVSMSFEDFKKIIKKVPKWD